MLKRIVFAPVCAVLYVIEVFLNMIENVYGFIATCIWALMLIVSVSAVCRHMWNQLIITGGISLLTFLIMFFFALIHVTIEETRKMLWRVEKEPDMS